MQPFPWLSFQICINPIPWRQPQFGRQDPLMWDSQSSMLLGISCRHHCVCLFVEVKFRCHHPFQRQFFIIISRDKKHVSQWWLNLSKQWIVASIYTFSVKNASHAQLKTRYPNVMAEATQHVPVGKIGNLFLLDLFVRCAVFVVRHGCDCLTLERIPLFKLCK